MMLLKNRLPEEKIRRLESIGIIWRLNSDEYFEYYYKAACDYRDAHGDINVNTDFVTEDGVHLGDWLCRQRSYYRKNILEEWKIRKMFCLAPDWIDGTTDWEKMYRAARKIYDETGSLENSGTVDLRRWIHSQQKWVSEKHDDSVHVKNRLCLLKAIGIRGYSQKDIDFEKGFRAARKYYIRHNNLLVPKDYTLDGIRLGQWIRSQRLAARSFKAEERLSDEKIRRLTEIGMDWMSHEERKWEEYFQRAKRFFDEHGTVEAGEILVLEDGFDLGKWIRKQLTWDYEEFSFSMYYADKLESIGIHPEIIYQNIPKIQKTDYP